MNNPRLFVKGKFRRVLYPITESLTLNMIPLSSASMKIPKGESIPMRSYVELFSPYGSAGYFRPRSPQDSYGEDVTAIELEHMIAEVGDYLVKEKISKMMNAETAVKQFWKYYKGTSWKLGSVTALYGKVAVNINYDNVLNGLLDIMGQQPKCMITFDYTTSPWTMNIVRKPTNVTAECRLSRNVTDARIAYDDANMCTRVYYETFTKNGSEVKSTWKHKDADTRSEYGTIERTVNTDSDMTEDEINEIVDTFLEEHKQPRLSVSIEGIELSRRTGESLDRFETGKLLRLVVPEDGVKVERHVHSLEWSDVYGDPDRVTVQIGDEEDTVVTFLHNLDKTGRGGGGGGGGGGGAEKPPIEYWKEFVTEIKKTDTSLRLYSKQVDKNNEILKQAGMDLDRNGVLIYAENSKLNIGSQIKTVSNRISLVVTKKNGKDVIDVAKIVTGINEQTGSFALIKAKTINLEGYVKATQLETVRANIKNLMAGDSVAKALRATTVSASVLKVANTQATWKLANIPGYGYINYLGQ